MEITFSSNYHHLNQNSSSNGNDFKDHDCNSGSSSSSISSAYSNHYKSSSNKYDLEQQ